MLVAASGKELLGKPCEELPPAGAKTRSRNFGTGVRVGFCLR
jgi:hypothetical protein